MTVYPRWDLTQVPEAPPTGVKPPHHVRGRGVGFRPRYHFDSPQMGLILRHSGPASGASGVFLRRRREFFTESYQKIPKVTELSSKKENNF